MVIVGQGVSRYSVTGSPIEADAIVVAFCYGVTRDDVIRSPIKADAIVVAFCYGVTRDGITRRTRDVHVPEVVC